MIETEKKEERVLLIGVELQGMDNFDLSMEELASLAKTAGAVVVDTYRQKREKYDSKTFVGSGKLEEIALISAKSEDSRENLQALFLEKIKDIFESFTLRVPFSKSYKIHDLESVAILEERDYQDDGEVIRGYISEKNKWRLEEFYD